VTHTKVPKKGGWVEQSQQNGEIATMQALKATIEAETFLIRAVECVGFDWCINRLRQAKAHGGKIERIIDIAMRS
jgi:hypothetical protein